MDQQCSILIYIRLLAVVIILILSITINACNAEIVSHHRVPNIVNPGSDLVLRKSVHASLASLKCKRILASTYNVLCSDAIAASLSSTSGILVLLPRGGGSNTDLPESSSDTTAIQPIHASSPVTHNSKKSQEDEDKERWRHDLPPQLQKRRGSLHRLLIPTGPAGLTQKNHQYAAEKDDNSGDNCIDEEDKCAYCQVYLLGTAHVSKDSCADAKTLMEYMKPDVLFVELCNQRVSLLEEEEETHDCHVDGNDNTNDRSNTQINHDSDDDPHSDENKSIREMYRKAIQSNPNLSKTAALSSVLLSKVQGDFASKLGVSIGGEFREAYNVAKAQHQAFQDSLQRRQWEQMTYGVDNSGDIEEQTNGCTVVLGDRPVQLTLSRAYESLSIIGRIKLVLGLLWSCIKQPDANELKEWIDSILNDPNSDVLSKSIQELSRHFPTIKETLINERDTYMACKLLQTARIMGESSVVDGKPGTIVAVVGAGHCPGIVERIRQARERPDSGDSMIDCLKDIVQKVEVKA